MGKSEESKKLLRQFEIISAYFKVLEIKGIQFLSWNTIRTVFQGTVKDMVENSVTITAQYLRKSM